MENLVALGLVNMGLHHAAIQEVNRRITAEIHPSKPSFWFYSGDRLPDKNSPNFPTIHCNQIVYPTDWFAVPAKFWIRPMLNMLSLKKTYAFHHNRKEASLDWDIHVDAGGWYKIQKFIYNDYRVP